MKLTVDNNANDYPKTSNYAEGDLMNLLDGEYKNISMSGGVTLIAHSDLTYHFKELDVCGKAHVAILSDTDTEKINMTVDFLWGDRSGVVHVGKNQSFSLIEVDVYSPVNIGAYRYSSLELPTRVTIRDVWLALNCTLTGMDEIAVENRGELYIWSYANTAGQPRGVIVATNITVRAGGKFEPLAADNTLQINVTNLIVNSNGYLRTNDLVVYAYHRRWICQVTSMLTSLVTQAARAQVRVCYANSYMSSGSGGGHGGRGGRAKSGYYSGYAYDDVYTPAMMGSGGGNSSKGSGGRGGGIIYLYVSYDLRVEGRLHANGESGGSGKGGGAGGSIYLSVNHLDGTGTIETTGGNGRSVEQYRGALGQFGVSGELGIRPVTSLSGGQKSRVAFAVINIIKYGEM